MVFLIEGIDGCGKSTVVSKLKEELAYAKFFKESFPGEELTDRLDRVQQLEDNLSGFETIIYDRATALDDFIYQPIIEGRQSDLEWDDVYPLLAQCVIIYLDCKTSVAKDRLGSRGDDYINVNQLDVIATKYFEYLDHLPNTVRIDVTEMSEEEECEAVLNIIASSMNLYLKKRPKLAHIVPKGLLALTSHSQYHMSLAHLIKQDSTYRDFYKRMVAQGRYVLMDNGAAEGAQLNNEELYACWQIVHPTELVLPDTLCDKDDTLRKVKEAIPFFKMRGVTAKFMAVPQGKTFDEWCVCAENLVAMKEVHCLGVSKFLTIQTKDPKVRYKAVSFIDTLKKNYNRPDLEVHLLGCDVGPSEPAEIFRDFDFVRGCDTALAYIYAQAREELTKDSKRPAGEIKFLEDAPESTRALFVSAAISFDRIAGVINSFGDYTWF